MKQAIEQALAPLVAEPLWAIGRAASLVWFQFGERHAVADRQGRQREVRRYALHLDCPWAWTRSWGEIIVNHESDHDELSDALSVPVCCRSVEARDNGSFRMHFDDNTTLTVSVEADPDPAAEEYWRFLEPHLDTPHFVVGAGGVVR